MLPFLLTLFGIGLVLFVHEAGHFLAARAAGVRVEVFSLGFGPRLFGWRRGDTDYRISLLPLGGYVRMAGEDQTRPPLPEELGAQSPGWRLLIFSGGILMNFLFALVLIPILFAVGVPFEAPVAGQVEPGGPAWRAGVREGERILAVNGEPIHAFRSFAAAVALGEAEEVVVDLAEPDGGRRQVRLRPAYDEEAGVRRVGLAPSLWSPSLTLRIRPGSVAEEAGLRDGDRLIGVDGVPVRDRQAARLLLEHALLASGPLVLAVEREGERIEARLERTAPTAEDPPQIGVLHLLNEVQEVRDPRLAAVLRPGDRILRAAGRPVRAMAELAIEALRHPEGLDLEIEREGRHERLSLPPIDAADLVAGLWLDGGEEVRVGVRPGGPADGSGLADGDRILRAAGREIPDMATLGRIVRTAEGPLRLLVSRPGRPDPFPVVIEPRPLPRPDFGFQLEADREVVRTDGPVEAIATGLAEARRMILEIGDTIRGMLSGSVDSRNLGGIITIGTLTHSFASEGLIPLLFFLAMISIHLAVLNLLPVPALDGGHMLFVLIEMVRGRPLSPSTQGWLNLAGLVAVFSLILFVTMNDLDRLFG
ncbi:MAG: hypothetical protein D6702_05075 [Planctomycetota bacterium]|nr:MAG: hypothetical protein D6702_05075 [Planctomycetota bacterium]